MMCQGDFENFSDFFEHFFSHKEKLVRPFDRFHKKYGGIRSTFSREAAMFISYYFMKRLYKRA